MLIEIRKQSGQKFMDNLINELMSGFIKDSLDSTQAAILFIQLAGKENSQEAINYMDRLNQLSVMF